MRSIMDDATKLAHEAENCVKQAWNNAEKTATYAWHHPKQDALKFANDVEQLDIGEAKEAWNVGIHTLDAITGGPTPNAWLPLSKPSNHIQAIGADLVDIATLALPVAGVGRATAEVAGGVFETAEASGEITTQTGLFGRGAGGFTRSLGAEAVESSQVATRSEQLAVEGGVFGDGIGAEEEPKLFENQFHKDIPNLENRTLLSLDQFKSFNGRLNYVVTKEGNLLVGKRGMFPGAGHIDIASGEPVQAAGEFKIVNDQIKYIDNSSGHYQPSGINAQQAAEKAFSSLGFNIENRYVEKIWVNDTTLPRGGAWRAKR